jgi:hypothetical protein
MSRRSKIIASEIKAYWSYIRPEEEPDDVIGFFSFALIREALRKRFVSRLKDVPVRDGIVFAARLYNLVDIDGFQRFSTHLSTLTFSQAFDKLAGIECFRSRGITVSLDSPKDCDFTILVDDILYNVKIVTFGSIPNPRVFRNRIEKKKRNLPLDGSKNVLCLVLRDLNEDNYHFLAEHDARVSHLLSKTRRVDIVLSIVEFIDEVREGSKGQIFDRQLIKVHGQDGASEKSANLIETLISGERITGCEVPVPHAFETFVPWIYEIISDRAGKQKWWNELFPEYEKARHLNTDLSTEDAHVFRFKINLKWLSEFAGHPLDIAFAYKKAPIGRLINASSTTMPRDTVTVFDSIEPVLRNLVKYALASSQSFLGLEFDFPAIEPPLFDSAAPTDVASRFRDLPDLELDAVRDRYAHALQVAAWDIITMHEVGHIYSGHNDLKNAREKSGRPLNVEELRALELDADEFSIVTLTAIWSKNGMKFLGPTEEQVKIPQVEETFGENATACFIALTAYYFVTRMDLEDEWTPDPADVHPAPSIRRLHTLLTSAMIIDQTFPALKVGNISDKLEISGTPVAEAEELYRTVNQLPKGDGKIQIGSEIDSIVMLRETRDRLVEELEKFQRGRRFVRVTQGNAGKLDEDENQ